MLRPRQVKPRQKEQQRRAPRTGSERHKRPSGDQEGWDAAHLSLCLATDESAHNSERERKNHKPFLKSGSGETVETRISSQTNSLYEGHGLFTCRKEVTERSRMRNMSELQEQHTRRTFLCVSESFWHLIRDDNILNPQQKYISCPSALNTAEESALDASNY